MRDFLDIFEVILAKEAKKNLKKVPQHIQVNFWSWVEDVEENGIRSARKIPGYHDEPLKGSREGQRSVRLSKSYRAIYVEVQQGKVVVEVLEVNKHEY